MRVGVTCRFQNSYFSGATPQVAVILAKALQALGNDVRLLYPKGDAAWFIDIPEEGARCPKREEWSPEMATAGLDMLVEVAWFVPAQYRKIVAKRVVLFHHYPPLFHDMESSVYPFNPTHRDFTDVTEVWTWDHYRAQDLRYLAFLSQKPVFTLPFAWNFGAVDAYVKETGVPAWMDTAALMDSRVTSAIPPTLSWSARIVESNASNSSHCLIPLNIVSEIRREDPVRFSVHNGEGVAKNAFFNSNVSKNLLIPDMSGNFVPRIRLPDLCREKSFLVAHQRFRPMKGYLLDALYLGIPVLHNCEMLREFGYFYELNQIRDAVAGWRALKAEYAGRTGFFAAGAVEERKKALRRRFGLDRLLDPLREILADTSVLCVASAATPAASATTAIVPSESKNERPCLKVAFTDMWDMFNANHNFFLSLFRWTGAQHDFDVVVDYDTPNLLVYGPFGKIHKDPKYADIPKVFFTGENLPPRKEDNTFLNLGFKYIADSTYIRLPLWVLEINWFGEDPNAVINPRPVPLEACLKQDPAVLDAKQKFCAFVATNPRCNNRNLAFHVLNQWRGVDAGGRLFCNLPGGPIPAGLGGGGGELAKVEFYKNYKYAITFENEGMAGYTTEKLFHAKVAGCVPIYWGDSYVDRDFDSRGFLNANVCKSPEELIHLVENLEKDPAAWRRMAEVPALSEYKRHWCERTMEEIMKSIVGRVFSRCITFSKDAWVDVTAFTSKYNTEHSTQSIQPPMLAPSPAPVPVSLPPPEERRIVTAANTNYVPLALLLIASAKKQETGVPVRVYVWPNVTEDQRTELRNAGAEVVPLPTERNMGWPDFWDPKHFAWKLWIHHEESVSAKSGTLIIYADSGIEFVYPLTRIWEQTQTHGICLLEDGGHPNRRWCHPDFCKALKVTDAELDGKQLIAGFVGIQAGGPFTRLHADALQWAQKREVIVGEKYKMYTNVCMGHRHDQSILSVLSQRAAAPRLNMRDFYCDHSRRAAEQFLLPLYVHRGAPKMFVPFTQGIDEAYLINLERRPDRLERFKQTAPNLKEATYVWRATDGRAMTMTPALARLFRDNDFKWKKAVMGCAISHMGLWEKLANDKVARSYLIMEDDVRFVPDWLQRWKVAAPHVPEDADVIYLGGVLPPNKAALPSVAEAVNEHFGRIAPNTLFGGPKPRRYFHFCNYSYILTQRGAQKLCRLIQQRGIFTSGDHMIVNHGDGLLNIYFTLPLLAMCMQEEDPVYIKSDFNNFGRLDTFDSDLWNNNDHFSQEEVTLALAEDMRKIDIKVVSKPLSDEELKRLNEEHAKAAAATAEVPAAPAAPTVVHVPVATVALTPDPKLDKDQTLALWNGFLRAIALRKSEEAATHLTRILGQWYSHEDILNTLSWFRIFEQLILTGHTEMEKLRDPIVKHIQSSRFTDADREGLWKSILAHWKVEGVQKQDNDVPLLETHPSSSLRIYQVEGCDIGKYMESEWLTSLFESEDRRIEWKTFSNIQDLINSPDATPVVVYANQWDKSMSDALHTIVTIFQQLKRQIVLLHLSDEFKTNDIRMYESPAVKHVFRNYWRPGLSKEKVTVLPLGYAKGRSATGLQESPSFAERPHVWSFVGSGDRAGRKEALQTLQASGLPACMRLMPNWNHPDSMSAEEYVSTVRQTRFIPCMRGAQAMESFRLYEALEHGAIPFYVPAESAHGAADEYRALFNDEDLPLMAIPSWAEAVNVLRTLSDAKDVMEDHRKKIQAWWQQKKVYYKTRIQSILAEI